MKKILGTYLNPGLLAVAAMVCLILWGGAAFAGGSYKPQMEERRFYLENETKGDNPEAACYFHKVSFLLRYEETKNPLKTKGNETAKSPDIFPGKTGDALPYYDVKKEVNMKVYYRKCNINSEPYFRCVANGEWSFFEQNLGKLASPARYKFTQDCKLEKQ